MIESYAVGWFALALINANIAQVKGHSGSNWFLGSLFTGPVATFLLTMVERRALPPVPAS
jgi:hypothetical protein